MPDFSTQTEEFTPFSVISLDGTSHVAMSGKAAATVIRIKISYSSQTGKPLRNMRLCLRGRLLDDDETLGFFGY
ncbi:hypothetical protein GCK72_025456 [Caenorhabditis remanei]|uniref:Ubiquitin-like domain-containing protein n=1 Tax=Caenorhabditis remanei TaxID=31234 RepID=A0A6A5G359_CAERE|nr:hypothetical protein GCK72_025456 [Caenorhabditis remanei]KAF1748989.1 hypothetical protein GCK72_025456 [Caenorhabditis remanei]